MDAQIGVRSRIDVDICLGHLQLLELFVIQRHRVNVWSVRNEVPENSGWTFYVNNAIMRLALWFDFSWDSDLHDVIPPLDVLLVWYALLQDPAVWTTFMRAGGVRLNEWNWKVLVSR